jgi:dihydroflavonol-4-reductase
MSDAAVFVTGGSGFLGRAIVERLVAERRPVVALARSDASARLVERLGAQPVRGDVLETSSLVAGMRGCEVVYHAAGVNAFCLADPTPLFAVNVRGSRNVVEAAATAGVHRLVYTSSAATLGEERGKVGNEQSRHRGWFLSSYERSKFEAEREVLTAGLERGLEVVCLNPASVQGPGRTGGTARLLLDYVNGRSRLVVDSRLSVVDIADCAEGHVRAEARGRPGQRYVLCGASLTVANAIALLANAAGVERRPRRVPGFLAFAAAGAVEAIGRARGRRPSVCRELVRTLLHGHAYDGSKATRELGLVYTPIEETLRRALAWYAEQGLVRGLAESSSAGSARHPH